MAHSATHFDPSSGDSVDISFDLAAGVDVTLQIFLEEEDPPTTPVATRQQTLPAGPNVMAWDGRDDGGSIVPDEAYAYVLTASGAGSTGTYDPPRQVGIQVVGPGPAFDWTVPPTFNAHRNEFWRAEITITGDEAWLSLRVEKSTGSPLAFQVVEKPLSIGTHEVLFDVAAGPNGELAFSGNASGNYEVWLRRRDGTLRRLTEHPALDGAPAFSPDSRFVVFESTRSGQSEVWRLPAEGGAPEQLTESEAGARRPVWWMAEGTKR